MRQAYVCSWILALGLAVGSGCTQLIDVEGLQCNADADCTSRSLGDTCIHNVCVTKPSDAACSGAACADASTDMPGCTDDAQCTSAAAPRCMHSECVASTVAERFLCSPEEDSEAASENVHYSFQVVEFISRKAPQNLVVTACRSNDVTCDDPSARFEDTAGTGLVELDLPYGFLGYFEVKSDALPALSYLTKPLKADRVDRDLQVASDTTVQALASVAGIPYEPSKGIAMVEAFNCDQTPAGGVHFLESKGSATPFYLVNHLPNSEVNLSVYDANNNVADGGFLNVQPGFVTFTARYGVDGPMLGEFNASVRASTVTYIDMYF
jgi:hypothetical protein